MSEVIIRNSKTGEEYAVQLADFRRGKHYQDPKSGDMRTYEEAGFKIVSYGDGSEYTPLSEHKAD
jgi:hypothetical protein